MGCLTDDPSTLRTWEYIRIMEKTMETTIIQWGIYIEGVIYIYMHHYTIPCPNPCSCLQRGEAWRLLLESASGL